MNSGNNTMIDYMIYISRINQNKIDNEKIKKRIMDSLLNKIDENQHKVQEGDYLIMMNLLKQIYE